MICSQYFYNKFYVVSCYKLLLMWQKSNFSDRFKLELITTNHLRVNIYIYIYCTLKYSIITCVVVVVDINNGKDYIKYILKCQESKLKILILRAKIEILEIQMVKIFYYGKIVNSKSMVQSITNHKIPSFFFLFLCLRVSMSVNSLFRQSISVDTKKDFPHVTDYNRKIPVFLSHNIKMRNRINCELAIASLQPKPFALFLKWRQKLEER